MKNRQKQVGVVVLLAGIGGSLAMLGGCGLRFNIHEHHGYHPAPKPRHHHHHGPPRGHGGPHHGGHGGHHGH